ncbi:MAG TPA: glycosyltransferase family 39 protein [Patescibacteria group bacterium]|nr:glycosyltransferase family 39 protein [Patescibacteria group bacterium]
MLAKILNIKFLIIIVLFGAFLRFTSLNQMPPALNWDEISHGYNAYSILKTGKDQWGQLFPIANFRAYGDYPLPLNLYLTIPFEIVFGLSQTSIRLPQALLGTLTIVSVYFLAEGISKNKKISLLAAFLTAIDPWFLFPSRAVFQSNLSVFFLITALSFFFNREKNKWFIVFTHLCLGLTLYSYHSTRIFTPILIVILLFIYKEEFINHLKNIFKKREILISCLLFMIFFLPLPFILLSPSARARSGVVFIIDQGAVNNINNLRNSSTSPFRKLIYNKVTYFTVTFAKNYVNYFSPQFLFTNGGTQYQFSVPNQGILYLVTLPFLYFGFFILIVRAFRNRDYLFLLLWLLLAPIPAAITVDASAVIRATTMLPIPEILIAIGFYEFINKFKKYEFILSFGFIIVLLFSLENYLNIYANSYRTNYSWAWQYGYEQAVDYVKANYHNYDQIITTKAYGEPHEFFLFYLQYDPQKYLSDPNKITFYQSNWYWVDHFDKFWFVNDWQVTQFANKNQFITESKHVTDCSSQRCLLITTPNNHPGNWKLIDTIKFLDGKTAFEIYSNT